MKTVAKSLPRRALTLQKPSHIRLFRVSEIIRTRKIKFSSIQFCIGDLVLFDFICFQLSNLYSLFLLVLSICYHACVITYLLSLYYRQHDVFSYIASIFVWTRSSKSEPFATLLFPPNSLYNSKII